MSSDIESELKDKGYETQGVVSWSQKRQFYAVGFEASELPDEVLGYKPVTDPSLKGEQS